MRRKFRVLAFSILLLFAGLCIVACNQSPSYLIFTNQNQAYYEQISKACDEVRLKMPSRFLDGQHLSPDNSLLPAVLKELRPEYFSVTTNRVFLKIGEGRGAYGVAWHAKSGFPTEWELETYAESLQKVLFTR